MICPIFCSVRLEKAEYIFEFEGRRFKLVRGQKHGTDQLCTIVESDDPQDCDEVFEVIISFINRLSWDWGIGIYCQGWVGGGFHESEMTLETAKVYDPYERSSRNFLVSLPASLPDLDNETQDFALNLWNEAEYTKSKFLKVINYWRILELPACQRDNKGKPWNRAISWINSVPENQVALGATPVFLARGKTPLGEFLYDQFRNGIVHVTKEKPLKPYKREDRIRADWAAQVLNRLAKRYVYEELGIGKQSVRLKIISAKGRNVASALLGKKRRTKVYKIGKMS